MLLLNARIVFQNLDLVLLTLEALDPHMCFRITTYEDTLHKGWPIISSCSVQLAKQNNVQRKCFVAGLVPHVFIIDLIYTIQDLAREESWYYLIHSILQFAYRDPVLKYEKESINEKKTTQFLRRFRFLYRKYISDESLAYTLRNNHEFLDNLAMTNIYLLSLVAQRRGVELFFAYITQHNLRVTVKDTPITRNYGERASWNAPR